MLSKLFKHEFRSVGRIGLLLLAVTVGVTLLGIIYLVSPMFESIVSSSNQSSGGFKVLSALLGLLGLLSYGIMLFGVSVGYTLFIAVRFYRSMYSDEGYLTHTLPVKPSELMFVKVVTAGLCLMVMSYVIYFCAGFLALFGYARATDQSFFELLGKISNFLEMAGKYLKDVFKTDLTGSWIILIISALIMPFANVCIIFGSLSLGQYSWKNKGLMGILAFLGVRVAMSFANGIVNVAMAMFSKNVVEKNGVQVALTLTNGRYVALLAVTIIFAVGLYAWANHVISNRLNLE